MRLDLELLSIRFSQKKEEPPVPQDGIYVIHVKRGEINVFQVDVLAVQRRHQDFEFLPDCGIYYMDRSTAVADLELRREISRSIENHTVCVVRLEAMA
mgnify:CR=1 FL=1